MRLIVSRKMVAQQTGGSILFTASISGHTVNFPQPQVSYNVSKGATKQLTRSLSAEWGRYGIRVNSISPGYMDTILNEGAGLAEGRAIWASRNPMGRMGDPQELTGAIILLCSSFAGRYITGTDILVDGAVFYFLSTWILNSGCRWPDCLLKMSCNKGIQQGARRRTVVECIIFRLQRHAEH